MPHLPLRAMQAFEAFGRLGSVTAAADELGVSLGAVSQQLRKAEEAAGVRLVERAGRHVTLTARGRSYLEDLNKGFEGLRTAQNRVGRTSSDQIFTVSCLPSMASKWVAARLFDWQMRHPAATVRLVGEDIEPRLGPEQAEFRLSYGRKARNYLHVAELFTDWVVPACSPAFLKQNPVRDAADILQLPLLGIEWDKDQGEAPGWTEWAQGQGLALRSLLGQMTYSLSSAAIDAAINGRGFVLAQLSMAVDDILAGRLVVPVDARMRLKEPYFLAWDLGALEKPLGVELHSFLAIMGRQQDTIAARVRHGSEITRV
ncbi:LysR substrate-binding domain-containing protein [Stagnihabitans tardus]|uniref:LysR family transcriptional regulator n=1 Tax=Stagnihabitans tardus TaxID=2699202 RepID=A0AAE4YH88_9RHOB|nr:LysR substrate-binding domain-containing protein [Stagnihabitans tardus]NBZ90104.1 LysR family transcriptional regulator [Stagnihabitans tardus]